MIAILQSDKAEMAEDQRTVEKRLLILVPTGKDAELTKAVFDRAGIDCVCCENFNELCNELDKGVGAIMLPEEFTRPDQLHRLDEWLRRQPPWSDLPVLVLTRPGADSAAVARAMSLLGNVTVLERPTRVAALVSAARTALRARQRQYQIREHLAERQRAEEALIANDRRKDEFLAMLAHELRNPLAPIVNSLHILQLENSDDSAIAQMGGMMTRQVSHMVRLVDDLLEVSRITRDKIELRKTFVELGDVITSALETSSPVIEAAGHRLEVDLPTEVLVLEADPVRLAQVFSNLLNNAAKYTDAGGSVRLGVRHDGAVVEISVRDSGVGIPGEMLPRVFDLFMQVDCGSTRAQGGLGIGLTLVKRLVEMHGGTVSASSAGRGLGSEFVVRLPLVSATPVVATSPPPERHDPALAPRRVLVVDDNHDAGDSLGLLLKLLGAEVRVVYSGADALLALQTYDPEIVFLDIGMPGMDGHEVARCIRQQPGFEDVTLIAMTGWGQEADRRRTREAGFDHHLIKPADMAALEALLLDEEPLARGEVQGRGEAVVPGAR